MRSIAIGDGTDTIVLTDHRRRGLALGLRHQVRRLRRQAARRGASAPSSASTRPASSSPRPTATPSPDFIGGWGFVPDWYMTQVTDTIKHDRARGGRARWSPPSSRSARCRPAPLNSERRDTYRSAEEQQAALAAGLRARPRRRQPARDRSRRSAPTPPTRRPRAPTAASPTPTGSARSSSGLEERFGGIGLHFMTGLGNMSAAGDTGHGARRPASRPSASGTPVDRHRRQSPRRRPGASRPPTCR